MYKLRKFGDIIFLIFSSQVDLSALPSVAETFPTLRYMLEAMNVGVKACNLTCAT